MSLCHGMGGAVVSYTRNAQVYKVKTFFCSKEGDHSEDYYRRRACEYR
jgi:hypothetical protein